MDLFLFFIWVTFGTLSEIPCLPYADFDHFFPAQICQLEHFNKVHKKHCKYFLGTKVKDSSLHNPYTCTKCQHVRALGKHNMTFEEGGLVCIFDYQAFTTGALQLLKNKKVGR